MASMTRDSSTLVYPGGETRCIYSTSTPFSFQVFDTSYFLFMRVHGLIFKYPAIGSGDPRRQRQAAHFHARRRRVLGRAVNGHRAFMLDRCGARGAGGSAFCRFHMNRRFKLKPFSFMLSIFSRWACSIAQTRRTRSKTTRCVHLLCCSGDLLFSF